MSCVRIATAIDTITTLLNVAFAVAIAVDTSPHVRIPTAIGVDAGFAVIGIPEPNEGLDHIFLVDINRVLVDGWIGRGFRNEIGDRT